MMSDGVYIELFCVKDGVRYNSHITDIKDVTKILTNGLMDGIEKVVMGEAQEVMKNDQQRAAN